MTNAKLKHVIEQLHEQGKQAEIAQRLSVNRGPQTRLVVEGFFYPLWELAEDENGRLAEMLDFEAIQQKRPPDWTFERKI